LFVGDAVCRRFDADRGTETIESATPVALSLTVVREHQPVQAAGVLVRRAVHDGDVVLYFVTAGHPFTRADGQELPYSEPRTVNAGGTCVRANRASAAGL